MGNEIKPIFYRGLHRRIWRELATNPLAEKEEVTHTVLMSANVPNLLEAARGTAYCLACVYARTVMKEGMREAHDWTTEEDIHCEYCPLDVISHTPYCLNGLFITWHTFSKTVHLHHKLMRCDVGGTLDAQKLVYNILGRSKEMASKYALLIADFPVRDGVICDDNEYLNNRE